MADDSTLKTAKRKAKEAAEDGGAKRAAPGNKLVNPKRVRELKAGAVGDGPVLFWCVANAGCKSGFVFIIMCTASSSALEEP